MVDGTRNNQWFSPSYITQSSQGNRSAITNVGNSASIMLEQQISAQEAQKASAEQEVTSVDANIQTLEQQQQAAYEQISAGIASAQSAYQAALATATATASAASAAEANASALETAAASTTKTIEVSAGEDGNGRSITSTIANPAYVAAQQQAAAARNQANQLRAQAEAQQQEAEARQAEYQTLADELNSTEAEASNELMVSREQLQALQNQIAQFDSQIASLQQQLEQAKSQEQNNTNMVADEESGILREYTDANGNTVKIKKDENGITTIKKYDENGNEINYAGNSNGSNSDYSTINIDAKTSIKTKVDKEGNVVYEDKDGKELNYQEVQKLKFGYDRADKSRDAIRSEHEYLDVSNGLENEDEIDGTQLDLDKYYDEYHNNYSQITDEYINQVAKDMTDDLAEFYNIDKDDTESMRKVYESIAKNANLEINQEQFEDADKFMEEVKNELARMSWDGTLDNDYVKLNNNINNAVTKTAQGIVQNAKENIEQIAGQSGKLKDIAQDIAQNVMQSMPKDEKLKDIAQDIAQNVMQSNDFNSKGNLIANDNYLKSHPELKDSALSKAINDNKEHDHEYAIQETEYGLIYNGRRYNPQGNFN